MIVWTENSSCEIALSFQEKEGCDDLWKRIREVSYVLLSFCLFFIIISVFYWEVITLLLW